MRKNQELMIGRRVFVKRSIAIAKAKNKEIKTEQVVKRLSKRLFLSESTIWKDLAHLK